MNSDDESILERACALREQNPPVSWAVLGKELKLSGNAMRCRVLRWRKRHPEIADAPQLDSEVVDAIPALPGEAEAVAVFDNLKEAVTPDWRKIVDIASQTQAILADLNTHQRVVEITIETDKPVEILFTGDWHLGDGATNHLSWLADMDYVLENKIHIISLGDLRQNMRTFKVLSGVLGQVLQPRMQAELFMGIVNELAAKQKLLLLMDGNHEDFDARIFGENLQSYLLQKTKVPRCSNRALIKLRVGTEKMGYQLYTILAYHKSRFRSILNPNHGGMREADFSYPADITAGAHDHKMSYQVSEKYSLAQDAGMGFGGERLLIAVGTYQDSEFGWQYFHDGGRPKMPVVTLWPDQHEMAVRATLRPAGFRSEK